MDIIVGIWTVVLWTSILSSWELAGSSCISVCIFFSLYMPYISCRYFLIVSIYLWCYTITMVFLFGLWCSNWWCLKNHVILYINGAHIKKECYFTFTILKDESISHWKIKTICLLLILKMIWYLIKKTIIVKNVNIYTII